MPNVTLPKNAVNVLTGGSAVAAVGVVTAPFEPIPGRLYVMTVWSNDVGGGNFADTVVHAGGLVWVQMNRHYNPGAAGNACTQFRAMKQGGLSAGVCTITHTGGANSSGFVWTIDEITNVAQTGVDGAGAIVQAVNTDAGGTSVSVALAANAAPENGIYASGSLINIATGITPGAGYTEISERHIVIGGQVAIYSEWRTDNATVAGFSWATAGTAYLLAVELAGITVPAAEVAVPITADQFLARDTSVIAWTIRWDLIHGSQVRELAVDKRTSPTISWDITRPIMRQVDRLKIPARQLRDRDDPRAFADDVDVYSDRFRPSMVVPGAGYEQPLGLFLPSLSTETPQSTGVPIEMPCDDLGQLLAQKLPYPVGMAPGDSVYQFVVRILDTLGIIDRDLEPSTVVCTEPVGKAQGTDAWNDALLMAHAMLAWLPPHFRGTGTYTGRTIPDINAALPDIVYGKDEQLVLDSARFSRNQLTDANQYQVTDTAAGAAPIVGIYNIPDDAPGSMVSRGESIPRVRSISMPGIGTVTAANTAAKAAYVADPRKHILATAQSPVRPHDAFWVVAIFGVQLLEVRWDLPTAGPTMSHEWAGMLAPSYAAP